MGVCKPGGGNDKSSYRNLANTSPLPPYGDSRDAGKEMQFQALHYAANVRNIRIDGSGVVDGRGRRWWDLFLNRNNMGRPLKAGRPNLIQIVNLSGVHFGHDTQCYLTTLLSATLQSVRRYVRWSL